VAIQQYVVVFRLAFNFSQWIRVHKTSSIYILFQTATCMRNIDELRESRRGLAAAYDNFFLVQLADPTNNDAKMKLANIYEIMESSEKH
jgi:general transcription factor 3C polypeptide 3 (transcription factor C subunit 4)